MTSVQSALASAWRCMARLWGLIRSSRSHQAVFRRKAGLCCGFWNEAVELGRRCAAASTCQYVQLQG